MTNSNRRSFRHIDCILNSDIRLKMKNSQSKIFRRIWILHSLCSTGREIDLMSSTLSSCVAPAVIPAWFHTEIITASSHRIILQGLRKSSIWRAHEPGSVVYRGISCENVWLYEWVSTILVINENFNAAIYSPWFSEPGFVHSGFRPSRSTY